MIAIEIAARLIALGFDNRSFQPLAGRLRSRLVQERQRRGFKTPSEHAAGQQNGLDDGRLSGRIELHHRQPG